MVQKLNFTFSSVIISLNLKKKATVGNEKKKALFGDLFYCL